MIALIVTVLIDTSVVKINDLIDKYLIPMQGKLILFSINSDNIYHEHRIDAHYIFVHMDKNNNKTKNRIYVENDDRKYFNSWKTFSEYYLYDNPKDGDGNYYPIAWVIPKLV